MSNRNSNFFVEEDLIDSHNLSTVGKVVEQSWDSKKYLTYLKGLLSLLEKRYILKCDFPLNPDTLKTQTIEYLQSDLNTGFDDQSSHSAIELSPNLNFSLFLLKSMDDINGCFLSLDLIKQLLPALCKNENSQVISHYVTKLFDLDRLQLYPELLKPFLKLSPLEKKYISRVFCNSFLTKNCNNREFYRFILTHPFIFDIIEFEAGHEFWSYIPVDLVDQNRDSLVNTLNFNNIEFYSYLPKFYRLLANSSDDCDQLLTFIKNKNFNICLLLLFNVFINKIDLVK